MTKLKKIISLVLFLVIVAAALTSCNFNTVSTGTKYDTALIGSITKDGNTLNDSLWAGVKAVGTNIKYYPLADYSGNVGDSVSLQTARANAIIKQIELANAGGAAAIVIPPELTDVFSDIFAKYTESSYGGSNFLIVTYPGAALSDASNLKVRMTALVIDVAQLGYIFGYSAVKAGYRAPGFIGVDGDEAKAFYAGVAQGAQAAAAELSVNVTFNYALVADTSAVKAKADELYTVCDVVVGTGECDAYVVEAAKAAGKAAMSTVGLSDDAVVIAYTKNDTYKTKIGEAITACKTQKETAVKTLSAGDLIYSFSAPASTSFKNTDAVAAMLMFQNNATSVSATVTGIEFANVTITAK